MRLVLESSPIRDFSHSPSQYIDVDTDNISFSYGSAQKAEIQNLRFSFKSFRVMSNESTYNFHNLRFQGVL